MLEAFFTFITEVLLWGSVQSLGALVRCIFNRHGFAANLDKAHNGLIGLLIIALITVTTILLKT